jgi:hypothetical protein
MRRMGLHNWTAYGLPEAKTDYAGQDTVGLFLIDDGLQQEAMVTFRTGNNYRTRYGTSYGYYFMKLPGTYTTTNRLRYLWRNEATDDVIGISSSHAIYLIKDIWAGQMELIGQAPINSNNAAWPDYWMDVKTGRLHLVYREVLSGGEYGKLYYLYSVNYGKTWIDKELKHFHIPTLVDAQSDIGMNYIGRPTINGWGDTIYVFCSDGWITPPEEEWVGAPYDPTSTLIVRQGWEWIQVFYAGMEGGEGWHSAYFLENERTGTREETYKYNYALNGWVRQTSVSTGTSIREVHHGAWDPCPMSSETLYVIYAYMEWDEYGASTNKVKRVTFGNPEHSGTIMPMSDAINCPLRWFRDYCKKWVGADKAMIALSTDGGGGVGGTEGSQVYDIAADANDGVFWHGDACMRLPQTVTIPPGGYSFWW